MAAYASHQGEQRNHSRPPSESGGDIAIIGMAVRLPGANSLDEFWANLAGGVESITFLSDDELLEAGEDPRYLRDPNYVRAAALIDDVENFDAAFFGFTPREADVKDPQHRVFLEVAYHALQHAACDPQTFAGDIGVFGGVFSSRYLWLNVLKNPAVFESVGSVGAEIASAHDYLATTVSHRLNLIGPSLTVGTACSTSLVAAHLACQALRNHECDLALAGGVEIDHPQKKGYFYSEGGIFSPDGHVRAFDHRGRGTIFGSGAGVVVLRRVEDALAAGDCIHAVIKASAINNDGSAKSGFTAPSVNGQALVLEKAYRNAGLDPRTVTFVEAHGTGTAVGDPIEVEALSRVFRSSSADRAWCAIGSVKTNIGHLGPAAGVTSLIKAALALRQARIPPVLHFEAANPAIDFESSPFFVNTSLMEWKGDGGPRRAGVSSFGIGGTNAHVILEEAPPRRSPGPASRPYQLLIVSAKTRTALDQLSSSLGERVRQRDADLADVGYTLAIGREAMRHRRIAVCRAGEEAASLLRGQGDAQLAFTALADATARPIAFMFPGQGTQHPGMGLQLYEHEPVFRAELDRCCAILQAELGFDLRSLLYPPPGETAAATEQLQQTALTQPALFAVEYSLAQLWLHWGIKPTAMIGHSLGEYVAACLAGVFTLPDALRLVAIRGRLMQERPAGAMLALPASEEEVLSLLEVGLSLASVNGPQATVVSGPVDAIREFSRRISAHGLTGTLLHTSHAFHSAMMDPILDRFAAQVLDARPRPPTLPFASNLTGDWISEREATDPQYWARHLRSPVRFADGIDRLLQDQRLALVEVGPGAVLTQLVRQQPGCGRERVVVPSLRHPQREASDQAVMLASLGRLWANGVPADWDRYYADQARLRVDDLPLYPFERKRHWVEPVSERRTDQGPGESESSGRLPFEQWFSMPVWHQRAPLPPTALDPEQRSPWLIFSDSEGLGAQLATALEALDQQVTLVVPSPEFGQDLPRQFRIRPAERSDYLELLRNLNSVGGLPKTIVHLWMADPPDEAMSGPVDRCRSLELLGFRSLAFLAAALAQYPAPRRVAVVGTCMQDVLGGEALEPAKAAILGAALAMPKELAGFTSQVFDVNGPQRDVVEWLLRELAAPARDDVVALRRGRRWVRGFDSVRLQEPPPGLVSIRPRGVYMITGGLGGVGLILAEELARQAQARIVLVSRSGLPERELWDGWLREHPPHDRLSRQIGQVRTLESMGAEVLVFRADVTDPIQMQAAVDATRRRFGELNGVIHAAGVAGGRLLAFSDHDSMDRVLRPKVLGSYVLASVLRDLQLDLVLFCSSIIAYSADMANADYSAGNNVLDAFAHSLATQGVPALSINWPGWLRVGMAVESALGTEADFELVNQPLLDKRLRLEGQELVYVSELAPGSHWLLSEHTVAGHPVLPGVGSLELALEAFKDRFGDQTVELRDVLFMAPLQVAGPREVRTILRPDGAVWSFTVAARESGGDTWREYARGLIGPAEAEEPAPVHDVEQIKSRCTTSREVDFARNRRQGAVLVGDHWDAVSRLWQGPGEELIELQLREPYSAEPALFQLHPALFDCATSFGPAAGLAGDLELLPFSYGRILVRGPLPARLYTHARVQQTSGSDFLTMDLRLFDPEGRELVQVDGFTLRLMPRPGGAVPELEESPLELSPESVGVRAQAEGGIDALFAKQSEVEFTFMIWPEEAIESLRSILAAPVRPQVIVCPEGIGRKVDRTRLFTQERLLEQLEDGGGSAPVETVERNLASEYVAPASDLQRSLAGLWEEALGVVPVGLDDDFFELGGNSLVAVQLAARIRERFKIELALPALFERPTVRVLAELVDEALMARLEEMPEEEAALQLAQGAPEA